MFIDRTPAALKNVAVQHFGTHGRTVLLLGMYAAIAVVAVGIGVLARRAAAPGVAGLAAFSLIAAFVTMTRPGGRGATSPRDHRRHGQRRGAAVADAGVGSAAKRRRRSGSARQQPQEGTMTTSTGVSS